MDADEVLHPGHHSIRLRHRDYSGPGFYFVTICVQDKRCLFGRVAGTVVKLTAFGRIARECWMAIPEHFAQVTLHAFVVMPNHVHGLIEIGWQAGAQHAAPLQTKAMRPQVTHGSLGAIVRSFKAAVTRRAREELRWKGEVWQRNYFERVLRNGHELADAGAYIQKNVRNWESDRDKPEREKDWQPR